MRGAEAPLGHIAQIEPEGKTWEIIATGFRNQYDAAVNREEELFTFDPAKTRIQGVEPTNNSAERALRPAVIQRKLSLGTQSDTGSRFLERTLSVSETCRLQQRSVYDDLIQAVSASFSNNPSPSLLPAR